MTKFSFFKPMTILLPLFFVGCNNSTSKSEGELLNTSVDIERTSTEDSDLIIDGEKNDEKDPPSNPDDVPEDSDNFTDICSSIETNPEGNEVCPSAVNYDNVKWSIISGCHFPNIENRKGYSFTISEIQQAGEKPNSRTSVLGIFSGKNDGNEVRCWSGFFNYDLSLFNKAKLLGREWVIYTLSGFYGSPEGEYVPRDLTVVREKDGTLVYVAAVDVTDSETDRDGDVNIWPSDLVPEIKSKIVVPENCMPTECEKMTIIRMILQL